MRELQAELRRGGERSLTLTDQDRYEFHAAKEKLIPLGAGIMEAVDFFIAHAGRVVRQPIMMEELVRMCVEAKRAEGKRARYLTQLRCTGLAFAGHVGEMRLGCTR